MNALSYFARLCNRMENLHPHLQKSTLMSAPSIEYKGRAFAMMHGESIVLKLDDKLLPETKIVGWQYFRRKGRALLFQQWVEVPFYYHTDWPDLVEKALDRLKSSLGE
jgi:hypothetical protein